MGRPSVDKFSSGYQGKKRKGRRKAAPKRVEVAGPYRSQSSNPEVREDATRREHRKVTVKPQKSHKPRAAKKSRKSRASSNPVRKARRVAAAQEARRERIESEQNVERLERRALKGLKEGLKELPPSPAQSIQQAKVGIKPPIELMESNPRAYKKAEENFIRYIGSTQNLKEDPLAEMVIGGVATAGVGLGARALGTGAKAVGSKILSSGADDAVESGAKAVTARTASRAGTKARAGAKRVRTAPARTVKRVREAPKKVKQAPKKAKRAATTKEGRRAALKGAGRSAKRHPVRTGYGAAAMSPVPLPGDIDERARAFAKGTAAAVVNHPGKVAETTGQGALGAFTAPLALGGAAVQSVKKGSPDPLVREGTELVEGTAKMVKNLGSGDPKIVEETTLQETGVLPFIPVPHVVRRAKRTDRYQDARGRVREKVEDKRSKTRDKRIAEQNAAVEKGEFVPKKKAKKIRQSIPDSERPGENYVLRRTGKKIEKQRSRHYVAREVTRMEEEGTLAGKATSTKVAKPLQRSKGTKDKVQNDGEAVRIFVKHGLPVEEKAATAFVKRLHDNWDDIKEGDIPAGIHLDRHSTQYILDHPEIFHEKRGQRFLKAVKEFNKQAKKVGTSPRNQYLAQVDNIINPILKDEGRTPILKPEERVPATTNAILRAAVPGRTDPWSRTEALNYARDLGEVGGKSRKKALEIREEILNSMDGLMRPPDHGGAEKGVATTRATAFTRDMEKAFVAEARAEGQRLGLFEPAAYVADRLPSSLKGTETTPNYGGSIPLKKVWPSRGIAAKSGNAESSFESLLYNSVEAPRARAAMVRGLNRIFSKASREVAGKRFLTGRELERAINTGRMPDGIIPVRPQMLKSLLEGDDAPDAVEYRQALLAEVEHGQKLVSSNGDALRGEIEAAKATNLKGEKYAPMDAVAIHELVGHMEGPGGVTKAMGHTSNFVTRTILNSPAFAASQFAAEGIPGAAALGRNVTNVPKAIAAIHQINKLDPEIQAQVRAVVGSSVGLLGSPKLDALKSQGFMDPIRAAGGKRAWRHAWEIVNGDKLSRFDRARAGIFRETAAIAKVEGDFKKAEKGFHIWRQSANNLFKDEQAAVDAMRGMTPAERTMYVTSHPRLADKLMKSMNGMMGNWNSFTVFEKHIAPFAIFYPFQRYSVLWVLFHFPLDHPVVATGLALLGSVNAQELERIAATKGAAPGVLDYTKPVVAGETILPAGQRFFAGVGAVQQAALENKPAQALNTLSPALGIPIEAITGKNAYTNSEIDENGWLYAARQSASMSPFLRFIGLPEVGQDESPASQAFGVYDPLRTQRSVLNPYIGQTAEQFAEEKRLSKKFADKYGKGDIPGPFDSEMVQELLYGGKNGGPKPEMLPEVLKTIHEAEGASNFIKRKEAPFLPPDKPFTEQQAKLLEAVENAWQTGPNAKPKKAKRIRGGGIGGGSGKGIGGHPIGGSVGGGSVGGGGGGGIGGYSLGK